MDLTKNRTSESQEKKNTQVNKKIPMPHLFPSYAKLHDTTTAKIIRPSNLL